MAATDPTQSRTMLFDLRGRGRRRTVQAVYLSLAILMGGGLVLFGVGTGSGNGGFLNAFTGNGSNSAKPVVSQEEKNALRAIKLRPTDPAAWASMVSARDASAKQNFNSTTGAFTTAGKNELVAETQAWQHYLQLVKTPDSTIAILAARAYGFLSQYANEASAWELESLGAPTEAKGYECLAVSAYAANQTRKGDLASAKALSLVPTANRPLLKQQLLQSKTQPQFAQTC
jgi:hypothetical protein